MSLLSSLGYLILRLKVKTVICSVQRIWKIGKKYFGSRRKFQCRNPGLNQGPLDLQSNALPTELFRLPSVVLQSLVSYNLGHQDDSFKAHCDNVNKVPLIMLFTSFMHLFEHYSHSYIIQCDGFYFRS